MINPKCDRCQEELVEFGAILLSPPDSHENVRKFHLCISCFNDLCKYAIITSKVKD